MVISCVGGSAAGEKFIRQTTMLRRHHTVNAMVVSRHFILSFGTSQAKGKEKDEKITKLTVNFSPFPEMLSSPDPNVTIGSHNPKA